MKKLTLILVLFFVSISVAYVVRKTAFDSKTQEVVENLPVAKTEDVNSKSSVANPASAYCKEHGGNLTIVTAKDGSQFGLCEFNDYSCEEWTYYNGYCNIEIDAEGIRKALIAKGLNLSGMKVEVIKHLGKYIEGAVVPVLEPAGGGYVFAAKTEEGIKIVADGNGAIMCDYLVDYPDFPSYLIPECVDTKGNPIER